jgi:NAD(P)H dehydrogenase (quinone)
MRVLVILGHPSPSSFNATIAKTACDRLAHNGHEVVFHDLYAEGFDPVLSAAEIPNDAALPPEIAAHCRELTEADGVVVVHPNWWGQPPAILTGWIDRVMRQGVAYKFQEGDGGEGVPVGLLKARAAVVLNTSNTSEPREIEIFGDPLERLWKDCIFDFCGVKTFYRRMFRTICVSSPEQRAEWLAEADAIVNRFFPKTE